MSGRDIRPARLARWAFGLTAAGLLLTAAVAVGRSYPGFGQGRHSIGVLTIDDLHEGQLEAAAAVVLGFIAAVVAGRVRRRSTRRNLLLLAALSILAFDNLVSALLTAGFDSLSANRFATWVAAGNGLIGAVLLLVAVAIADEPLPLPRRAIVRTLAGCAGGVVTFIAVAWALRDRLPVAFERLPTRPEEVAYLTGHPVLLATEALAGVCWAAAGYAAIGIARRTHDDLTGWIGLGSVVAAVAFVNYTLFPSEFTELLYLGDYLYLVSVALLVVGAVREIGYAEAALVDSAVYAERRRIAREMHDGVAQELAYISAQTQAVLHRPELAERGLSRIAEAAERALDDSRSAIKELSGPVDEPLAHAIELTARVVGGRSGAEIDLDLDDTMEVAPPVRLALLRITREAVGNAVRHGHAHRVRVDLWQEGRACLRITDDGIGFTPEAAGSMNGFGLASIRERVESLAGELRITSAEGEGSILEVRIP